MPAKTFWFHPAAEREFAEAAEWYEKRRVGLGAAFVTVIRGKIDDIVEAPERWPITKGVRRAFVGTFPYAIVYRDVSGGEIEIVAVAYFRRRPKYWSRR